MRNRIHEFLSGDQYRPLKQHEIARALKVKGNERADFRHVLYEMERQGEVLCLRKNRWALPQQDRLIIGRLKMSVQGFGFVIPDDAALEDVFIPPDGLEAGLDDDRVMVSIGASVPRRSRATAPYSNPAKVQGRIVRVIERGHPQLAGLLRRTPYYWYVIPDNPRILHSIRISTFADSAGKPAEYHKVVIVLNEWTSPHRALTASVIEDLGPADRPGVDMVSVLRDHRLDTEFSRDAVEEAKRHEPRLSIPFIDDRRDLRSLLTFTIDPEDAKDFDDAVSLHPAGDGLWSLGIHIADVSHYVPAESAIDREAFIRGNSTYLVDRVITMLPPHLTTEICSLQPGEDRLTYSVTVLIDEKGKIHGTEIFRSVINSSARLDYDHVQAFLDGTREHGIPENLHGMLRDMHHLSQILRGRRMAEGSVDLTIPEIKCRLDESGKIREITKRVPSHAYQLIEEFMLAANCTVARFLADKGVPAIYRIHEPPDEEQWAQMQIDLQGLEIAEAVSSREDINRVTRQASRGPLEYAVHLAILRNLKRAVYSPAPREHFALGFTRYTHFTSPIRRYPDLVVHRALSAAQNGKLSPLSREDAARIAEHCSRTERNSDDAEEESVTIKRIAFFHDRLDQGDNGPHSGIVVSLVPKGLIVELRDSLQRGLIPFSSMHDDFYTLTPERHCAVGRKHRKQWKIGQEVKVCISRVDTVRRRVDLFLYQGEPPAAANHVARLHGGKRRKRSRNGDRD